MGTGWVSNCHLNTLHEHFSQHSFQSVIRASVIYSNEKRQHGSNMLHCAHLLSVATQHIDIDFRCYPFFAAGVQELWHRLHPILEKGQE
jgi:hypothetical protein